MAIDIILRRSATASKRPETTTIQYGELALDYNNADGGLYYKSSTNAIIKVGSAFVGTSAPNATPAGSAGNSLGEFWFDSAGSVLKLWNGSSWSTVTSPAVTSITAGTGLTGGTITTSGTIALDTTQVIQPSILTAKGNLIAASAASTPVALAVGGNGQLLAANSTCSSGLEWITASGTGTVTSVIAGTGLTGGTIDISGTIALANTAVTPGSYTNSSFTVDAQGRITAASNGAAPLPLTGGTMTGDITFAGTQTFPVSGIADATTLDKGIVSVGSNIQVSSGTISVASASTTQAGIVQLNNTTNSTSTTEALTAAQGKNLQDQIDALAVTSNITLGGTFDANTGFVDSVTTAGTAAGLTVGSALPAAASANNGVFVIIDVQGSTGPSGTPPYHTGDWFLSDGAAWQFLNVGFQAGQATTVSQGVVQLATDAEVQAGTDSSDAVVSSSLQSKLSDSVSTSSSTTIASSSAVKSAYDLANAALPKSAFTVLGDLVVGTGSSTYTSLTVGANGQVLSANSACPSGLAWVAVGGTGSPATPTVAGIVLGCTTATNSALGCNALLNNTGTNNTASGLNALCSNTTASGNTAVGAFALQCNTIGFRSTAVGLCALSVSTGSSNTAVGVCALRVNTTGVSNVGIGVFALTASVTGNLNVAVGNSVLSASISGCCNTGVGTNALLLNTTGNSNVSLGFNAGCNVTTGGQNVAIGPNALVASAAGSCQLAIGFSATDNWLTGNSTKAIQPGAGIIDCANSCGSNGAVLMSNGSNAVCWSPSATPAQMQGVLTTATASAASTAITVASGAGISNGDSVSATGIAPGTTVVSGGGTTSLVLSSEVSASLNASPITFYANTTVVTPGDAGPGLPKAWVQFSPTASSANWPGGASTLTRSAGQTLATVTTTFDHGLQTGGYVRPGGVTGVTAQVYQITRTGPKTFTFTSAGGTAGIPATTVTFNCSAIRSSYNVSSVLPFTGNASTTTWLVNFTTPMPDTNYLVLGSASYTSGASFMSVDSAISSTTTGGFGTYWYSGAAGATPTGPVNVVVFR